MALVVGPFPYAPPVPLVPAWNRVVLSVDFVVCGVCVCRYTWMRLAAWLDWADGAPRILPMG